MKFTLLVERDNFGEVVATSGILGEKMKSNNTIKVRIKRNHVTNVE